LIIKPENVTASYVFDELKRNCMEEDMVALFARAARRPPELYRRRAASAARRGGL
tara:strand:+ start:166 stop:330 length:165 start_codon:yes stop_codon:yes gene_type:complete